MTYPTLIAASCILWIAQSAAQDLNGFKIGMSKPEVCRYVQQHPTYKFQGETSCPDTDNRIVVRITEPGFSSIDTVSLAFDYRGNLSAMWSTFPSSDFNSVYEIAVRKFGKPNWNKEYRAGKADANLPNKLVYWHSREADIYLERENKQENGGMTGWLALNSPSSFVLIPPASFETLGPASGQVDPLYWDPHNSQR